MKYLPAQKETKPCSKCKKTYKTSYFGVTNRGRIYSSCPKCRATRNLDNSMKEPTIVLSWEQLLVRGSTDMLQKDRQCL